MLSALQALASASKTWLTQIGASNVLALAAGEHGLGLGAGANQVFEQRHL